MRKIFAMILVLAMVCSGVGYAEENEILSDEEIFSAVMEEYETIIEGFGVVCTRVSPEMEGTERIFEFWDKMEDAHYIVFCVSKSKVCAVAMYDNANNVVYNFGLDSEDFGYAESYTLLASIFTFCAEHSSEETRLLYVFGEETYILDNTQAMRDAAMYGFVQYMVS